MVWFEAAARGDIATLHILAQTTDLLDVADSRGMTALMITATGGHEECLRMLIHMGCELDVCDFCGWTAIMHAAFVNQDRCLQRLITGKAYLDAQDFLGSTALIRATVCGNEACLQLLLDHGADVDQLTPAESTAFHVCCLHGQLELAKLLIAADETPNINDANVNGYTPLHAPAFKCQGEMIELLLSNKADLHCREEDGWGALHFTAHNAGCSGSDQATQLLLAAGINSQLRISEKHAECEEDLTDSGETALDIVTRRLKQMSLVEAENAKKVQRILQEEQKRAKEEDRERRADKGGDKGKPEQRRSSIKKDSLAKAP